METLFDYDRVEIALVSDVKKEYPKLKDDLIERFTISVNNRYVIAIDDLNYVKLLQEKGLDLKDVNYKEVDICSVCRKVLLPDDEAYTDKRTGDVLCSTHSFFSEKDSMYHKIIYGD